MITEVLSDSSPSAQVSQDISFARLFAELKKPDHSPFSGQRIEADYVNSSIRVATNHNEPKRSLPEAENRQEFNILDRELERSGFKPSLQLLMLFNDYSHESVKQLNWEEFLRSFIDKNTQDIRTYVLEYLFNEPGLPIPIQKGEYEGKSRVIGRGYGHKPLLESTSKIERWGLPYSTLEAMEKFLLDSGSNAFTFYVSPKGINGCYQGEELISYDKTQIYCWFKDTQGEYDGFTIVLDTDLNINKQLLEKFGMSRFPSWDLLSEQEKISCLTRNYVTYDEDENQLGVEEVVSALEVTNKFRPLSQRINNDVFQRVRYNYQRRKELLFFNEKLETAIEECEELIRSVGSGLEKELVSLDLDSTELYNLKNKPQVEMTARVEQLLQERPILQEIYYRFEKTILDLSLIIDGKDHKNVTKEDYKKQAREVSNKKGCNGGGSGVKRSKFEKDGLPRQCKICGLIKDVGGCGFCESCQIIIEDEEFLNTTLGPRVVFPTSRISPN